MAGYQKNKGDIFAFLISIFFAPLIVGFVATAALFVTFPVLVLIPMASVPFGMPVYLIFAGPILYIYQRFTIPNPIYSALLCLAINMIVFNTELVINGHYGEVFEPTLLELRLNWGNFFAPAWGLVFALLYLRLILLTRR